MSQNNFPVLFLSVSFWTYKYQLLIFIIPTFITILQKNDFSNGSKALIDLRWMEADFFSTWFYVNVTVMFRFWWIHRIKVKRNDLCFIAIIVKIDNLMSIAFLYPVPALVWAVQGQITISRETRQNLFSKLSKGNTITGYTQSS